MGKSFLQTAQKLVLKLPVQSTANIDELSNWLYQTINLAQDDRTFINKSGKETRDELAKLNKALKSLRLAIENMSDDTYHNFNYPVFEGEIPLLDEACIKAGHFRTTNNADRLDIMHSLCESTQPIIKEELNRKGKGGRPKNEKDHFISTNLARIYFHATGKKPTCRYNDYENAPYGPFYDFVSDVLQHSNMTSNPSQITRLGSDHINKLLPG